MFINWTDTKPSQFWLPIYFLNRRKYRFFQNFGPNATTFVIPGEVFPTRYRSTAHGISVACGKLGALVSLAGLFKLKDIGGKNGCVPWLLIIFSGFMVIGLIFTFFYQKLKVKPKKSLVIMKIMMIFLNQIIYDDSVFQT